MNAPRAWDPCLSPVERPPLPGRGRVRVVELLATGTNGGAQEHVFSLVSRLDKDRYDATVVSLSAGSAVRKLQRAGFSVVVIDEPDEVIEAVFDFYQNRGFYATNEERELNLNL